MLLLRCFLRFTISIMDTINTTSNKKAVYTLFNRYAHPAVPSRRRTVLFSEPSISFIFRTFNAVARSHNQSPQKKTLTLYPEDGQEPESYPTLSYASLGYPTRAILRYPTHASLRCPTLSYATLRYAILRYPTLSSFPFLICFSLCLFLFSLCTYIQR